VLDGDNVWQLKDHEQSLLRNRKLGFVFQFPSLMPSLTALENVVLPAVFGEAALRNGVRNRACDLLGTVGLADKLHAYPRQLSAGQQQRVVIARSLIRESEILLADEPTSNLDERTETEIMELLRDIHSRTNITVLLVTHSRQLVRYGTRWLEMAGGRIVTETPGNS
jgi:putative ABC transport system ATP-binding protein/lipoprotein-releasing system ATP-binding protein